MGSVGRNSCAELQPEPIASKDWKMNKRAIVSSLILGAMSFLIMSGSVIAQTYDGQWTVTENVNGTACGEGNTVETYSASVVQSGTTMTVTAAGITRSGSINGTTLTFTATYDEDGGTVTSSGTIVFNGNTASGSSNWTYTDNSLSCKGSSTISATKVGGSPPATTTNSTLSGIIADANGNPIADATVTLSSVDGDFSATTGSDGAFNLSFDSNSVPANSAFTIYKSGYIPSAQALNTGSGSVLNFGSVNIEAISPEVVVLELTPDLHHLGDNFFSGSSNSSFQKSAEGTSFSRNFSLSSAQIGATSASITLLAKGLQDNNEVRVNGSLVGYLNSSPSNGSFGTVTFSNLSMGMFVAGSNTLTVSSQTNGSDYDDFEFTNILLRFAGIDSSNNQSPTPSVSSKASFANGVVSLPNVVINSLLKVDYYSLDLVLVDITRLLFSINNLTELSSATGSPLPYVDLSDNTLRVPEIYIENVRYSLTFTLFTEGGTSYFQLTDYAVQ